MTQYTAGNCQFVELISTAAQRRLKLRGKWVARRNRLFKRYNKVMAYIGDDMPALQGFQEAERVYGTKSALKSYKTCCSTFVVPSEFARWFTRSGA